MSRLLRPASLMPANVPDLEHFVNEIRLNAGIWPHGSGDAEDTAPVFIARAPGRLDVMGGIADYSGALVLQWPIHEATRVAVRPWPEGRIAITSRGHGGAERRCDVPLDLVSDPHRPYEEGSTMKVRVS